MKKEDSIIDQPVPFHGFDLPMEKVYEILSGLENIIYNVLIYRGFSVDAGIVEVREKQDDGTYKHGAILKTHLSQK